MARTLSDDERQRTVWLFGKPYHWTLEDDNLSLNSGISEYEQIRVDVLEKLLAGGVPEKDITQDMIEDVISRAEDAVIREAVANG